MGGLIEVKTDDLFPYADSGKSYWTGYFRHSLFALMFLLLLFTYAR